MNVVNGIAMQALLKFQTHLIEHGREIPLLGLTSPTGPLMSFRYIYKISMLQK